MRVSGWMSVPKIRKGSSLSQSSRGMRPLEERTFRVPRQGDLAVGLPAKPPAPYGSLPSREGGGRDGVSAGGLGPSGGIPGTKRRIPCCLGSMATVRFRFPFRSRRGIMEAWEGT